MRFARLFTFEAGQFLLNITTDNEIEGYVLNLETYYQGLFIRTGLPFESFGDASETMAELTEQRAQELFDTMISAIDNPASFDMEKGNREALVKFENWLNNLKNNPTKT